MAASDLKVTGDDDRRDSGFDGRGKNAVDDNDDGNGDGRSGDWGKAKVVTESTLGDSNDGCVLGE